MLSKASIKIQKVIITIDKGYTKNILTKTQTTFLLHKIQINIQLFQTLSVNLQNFSITFKNLSLHGVQNMDDFESCGCCSCTKIVEKICNCSRIVEKVCNCTKDAIICELESRYIIYKAENVNVTLTFDFLIFRSLYLHEILVIVGIEVLIAIVVCQIIGCDCDDWD